MNDSVKSLVEVSTRTINGKEVLAVTSLQVAKHFEKEHKHVLRDIRIILEADEDGFSESNFGLSSYLTEQNKEMPMYVMSKDGFVLLVMGYTGPEAMRMKKAYIARFNEMEEQLRAASPLLPNFRDPIAAAEAWIVAERARLAEQARADYYQRTKAEIGSRREATAMATASAAVRKAAALENELGRGRDYKSVKGIPWFLEVFIDVPAAYSVAGRKLSELSRRLGYEIREVEDTRYGIVKAYHADVITAFRVALRDDLNMMRKYRLRRAA
jgi:Rha family phage regulatory protein|nr:MAG TPA: regulatory protein [Caudoviricetes sp.]